MVITDHNKNIQRIVDRALKDITIFDEGKTKGLARAVLFGTPSNKKIKALPAPYIYVDTRDNSQRTTYSAGLSVSDSQNQLTLEYDIVLVGFSKANTIESQKVVNDMIKNFTKMVQDDPLFKDPVSGIDPVFTLSIINAMPKQQDTKGKLHSIVTLVLTATVGSNLTVTFPAPIGDLFILSSRGIDGLNFDEDNLGDAERVLTEKGDFGNIHLEYQSTFALDDQFRAKYGDTETITLTRGAESKDFQITYWDITSTTPFGGINRAVIHLEIVL